MMKVLHVAAEGAPFSKTGGLGDVVGALPKELKRKGLDVQVILPRYADTPQDYLDQMELSHRLTVHLGWRKQYCGVLRLEHQGVTFYFLHNETYFKRPGTYGYFDDGERFAFFNRGVLAALPVLGFQPDVIHCHDWHAGMIPVMLTQYRQHEFYEKIKTVFTIHNLKYQGVFSKSMLGDILGLGWEHFNAEGIEFHDQVSFMKGGLNYSDALTTVSPTYAKEIQTEFYGEDLEGALARRQSFLSGILNGIDYEEWNPRTDPHLPFNYDHASLKNKARNKEALQESLQLPINREIPILGMVSRLAPQKGLDLIAHVLEEILNLNLQLVVLGTGEKRYEDLLRHFAHKYPGKLSANIEFSNELAHRIYAASDLFLMPSLFEPCGLGQLISLRYGTLPIVRETGGLKDTVVSYNENTGEGNGFSFANYNAHDMLFTIERAIKLYEEEEVWQKLVQVAMQEDYSWQLSAERYKELYASLF